jgi:hypothetical protein
MRDEPGGRALMETARAALVAEVLPHLSGDARYAGAMIANALRMALADGGDQQAEREVLRALLGAEQGQGVLELNASLSAAIRVGTFDPGTDRHEAMRAALMSMTVERLALANPKALDAERASGAVSADFVPWE